MYSTSESISNSLNYNFVAALSNFMGILAWISSNVFILTLRHSRGLISLGLVRMGDLKSNFDLAS